MKTGNKVESIVHYSDITPPLSELKMIDLVSILF